MLKWLTRASWGGWPMQHLQPFRLAAAWEVATGKPPVVVSATNWVSAKPSSLTGGQLSLRLVAKSPLGTLPEN